jgi:hypothetical protein
MAVWYAAKLIRGQNIGTEEPEKITKYSPLEEKPRNIILRGFRTGRRKVI